MFTVITIPFDRQLFIVPKLIELVQNEKITVNLSNIFQLCSYDCSVS